MADQILSGLGDLGMGWPSLMDQQGNSVSVPFPIGLGVQGGIGFQFDGGIITVTGEPGDVKVNFDRPMNYNGDFTHVPGGTPYDIGQPYLAADTRSLSVPINTNSMAAPTVVATSPNTVDISFASPVNLVAAGLVPSNWSVSASSAYNVVALAVSQPSPTVVRLSTSGQTTGGAYTLDIPAGAVEDATYGTLGRHYSVAFAGVGSHPSLISATPLSSTSVRIVFSEAVLVGEALSVGNYVVSNGLAVRSVVQETATTFVLTTAAMSPNFKYTITASNIHNVPGNLVV